MRKMKTFLQMTLVAILALAVIGGITSVTAGPKGKDVMVLEYDFTEPQVYTKGDCDVVTVDGLETSNNEGQPRIPVKPVQILVPAGMEIEKVTSKAIDTAQLSGTYLLAHGVGQFFKDVGPPETLTQPDPEIYSMTAFWPAKQHELVTVQSNRGYNIAYVNLYPLKYSPKSGKIKMATKIELTVSLAETDSSRGAKPTKALKKKLEDKVENPDAMESYDAFEQRSGTPLTDPEGPYYGENWKYVVITPAALANISEQYNFQALCDSKIARGIDAGIVTTDWILANYDGTRPDSGSDNQTKIRNFLIDAYQTWSTEYALLAGDKDIIPPRIFRADGLSPPADLYYGCVDPADCTFDYDADGLYGEKDVDGPGGGDVDLSADVFVGRAGVETATEVANFVRKTLTYDGSTDAYLNHALSSGGYLGFGGIQEFSKPWCELVRLGSDLYLGHFCCGFLSPDVANAKDFTVATLYDQPDSWQGKGYQSIQPPWDDGIHGWDATTELLPILNGTGGNTTPQLIYCGDHGSPQWGFTKLSTFLHGRPMRDSILNLTNTKPFFFYDDSCSLGDITFEDCISEEITAGIEYGAFACITLSNGGLGSQSNDLDSPTAMFTREFYHSVLGDGIFEMGPALQDARDSLLWRSGMAYFRFAYYEHTLFGDPELRLKVIDDTSDVTAPTPDPMTWATEPYTTGDHSITMAANTATDSQNGVQYKFTCTAGADNGGTDSLWQIGTSYTDTGLAGGVQFTYTVTARDTSDNRNETTASTAKSATTTAEYDLPTPDPMTWATVPYATSAHSIAMVATTATDPSCVEYNFICTAGGGNDSGWQDSTSYEDTGLQADTQYTYTVTARDKSSAQNTTAASSTASATTEQENVVLPESGGVLEYYTSQYNFAWGAALLTNKFTNEDGWASEENPSSPQEFIYSFLDGNDATLDRAVIHGGSAEGGYFSKDVEVWTSANGTDYTLKGSDTLLSQYYDSVTIDLGVVAKKVKLAITSGYNPYYWDLAEFQVYGMIGVDPDTDPPTPDPMTWATVPYATGSTSIAMVATTATDSENDVEYYFTCTAGGGNDSGWQDSTSYEDTGLSPDTQYTYTVTARDTSCNHNETAPSTAESATTDADLAPPTPDPMTWASVPAANGDLSMISVADVTASSEIGSPFDRQDDYIIDGSGLTDGEHNTTPDGFMWLSTSGDPDPSVTFDLGAVYTIDSFRVWNYNEANYSARGVNAVSVEYGTTTALGSTVGGITNFTQAPGTTGYTGEEFNSFTPFQARYIKFDINSNHGDGDDYYGLSEVQFYDVGDPETEITMTATTASDSSGVEYYFTCTAGGGNDSLWQDSTVYTDTGLTPETQYTYTVTARDKSTAQNETAASTAESATTTGGSDTDPPTPNPATFSSAPAAVSSSEITMTATTGTDATTPVEYYFDETTDGPGATDSGWVTDPVYNDNDLDPDTQYTYTVQMRDSASTPNVGTVSSPANATTLPEGCTPTDMHIEAVVCSEVSCGGPNKNGVATVTIYDDCGDPVSGALVDVTFTGDISETVYDVATNSSGVAVVTSTACVKRPSFTATVIDVTDTLPYDSNDDVTDNCSG